MTCVKQNISSLQHRPCLCVQHKPLINGIQWSLLNCHLPQRGKSLEIVKPLAEQWWAFSWSWWSVDLPVKKAGFSGLDRLLVSLFNIRTTDDIVGFLFASSWAHNNPIWMYLKNSFGLHESFNNGSINSNPFVSFHNCQACN